MQTQTTFAAPAIAIARRFNCRAAAATVLFVTAFAVLAGAPAAAKTVTPAELLRAATLLGQRYDRNYAAKDPVAMAALYARDGVLVSPAGPLIHGRPAFAAYYRKRFASGAERHAIRVIEVHPQGAGGYGIAHFAVTVRRADGTRRRENGTIVAVYVRDLDGWHLRLVQPSVPAPPGR